jgi:hypothetical protein
MNYFLDFCLYVRLTSINGLFILFYKVIVYIYLKHNNLVEYEKNSFVYKTDYGDDT